MIRQYNVRVILDDESDTVQLGFVHELVGSKGLNGIWKTRSSDKMAKRLNKSLFKTVDGNTLKPVQK